MAKAKTETKIETENTSQKPQVENLPSLSPNSPESQIQETIRANTKSASAEAPLPEATPTHPLDIIQEKYKDIPLHEANKRFRNEYLNEGRKQALFAHYKDNSLDISLEEDKTCPTAYIDLKTGKVRVSKSIALACMEGKRDLSKLFNYDALNFLIHHELSHFKDLVSPDKKMHTILPDKIQKYREWLEKLNDRIWEKWEKEFVPVLYKEGEYEAPTLEEREKLGTPLHKLYHRYLNVLDDCVVNTMALSQHDTSRFDSIRFYNTVLFHNTEYNTATTPRAEQFGYYILQKIMDPSLEIKVDEEVQKEIDKQYEIAINRSRRANLLQIMQDCCYHHRLRIGPIRYTTYYDKDQGKYFLAPFERLIDLDLKDAEKREEFKKMLEELMKNEGEGKEGKPQKGEPKEGEAKGKPSPLGSPNPFQKPIDDAKDAEETAKKQKEDSRAKQKADDAEKAKSDSERLKEAFQKYGSNFAETNNLDLDKTQRYFEIKEQKDEEIEELSNSITNILLRNKMEAIRIYERFKKSGDLNVKDLMAKISGILSGENTYSTKVYDRKIISDQFLKRIIGMKIRLLIDNSGSMTGLISELEEIFVIVSNAIRLANYKLEISFGIHANLNTEMILFGNSFDPNSPNSSGGRRIKEADGIDQKDDEFHSNLINAFSKITCNEGTDDSDAWKKIADEFFTEEEVKVTPEEENISIATELTDGYVWDSSQSRLELEKVNEKGINTFCLFFNNEQALDQSLSDITGPIYKEFNEKIAKESSPHEQERLRRDFQERMAEEERKYNEANAEAKSSNPLNFWGDRLKKISSPKDIIPYLLIQIMEAVNQVDEKLGKDTAYSLEHQKNLINN